MKAILFITLFMLVSLETTEQSSDVDFYKCLLLDSDVVFNHLNSLVEAIKTLDPVKLVASFTSIYPAIVLEVNRCRKEVSKNNEGNSLRKLSEENIQEKSPGSAMTNLFKALLKAVTQYFEPFLKKIGVDLKGICKDAFSDVFICDLLE